MYHVMACRSALFGPWYSHHTLLTDCWESKVVKQGGSGFFYMRVRACARACMRVLQRRRLAAVAFFIRRRYDEGEWLGNDPCHISSRLFIKFPSSLICPTLSDEKESATHNGSCRRRLHRGGPQVADHVQYSIACIR